MLVVMLMVMCEAVSQSVTPPASLLVGVGVSPSNPIPIQPMDPPIIHPPTHSLSLFSFLLSPTHPPLCLSASSFSPLLHHPPPLPPHHIQPTNQPTVNPHKPSIDSIDISVYSQRQGHCGTSNSFFELRYSSKKVAKRASFQDKPNISDQSNLDDNCDKGKRRKISRHSSTREGRKGKHVKSLTTTYSDYASSFCSCMRELVSC